MPKEATPRPARKDPIRPLDWHAPIIGPRVSPEDDKIRPMDWHAPIIGPKVTPEDDTAASGPKAPEGPVEGTSTASEAPSGSHARTAPEAAAKKTAAAVPETTPVAAEPAE